MASPCPRRLTVVRACWLWWLVFLAALTSGRAASVPKKESTATPVRVTLAGVPRTFGRQCRLPQTLAMNISWPDGGTLQLALLRNPRVVQDALHFVPRTGEDGALTVLRAATQDLQKYALYHDTAARAAMTVTCSEASHQEPEVEGTLFHKGRRLSLGVRSRQRRSAVSEVTPPREYELRSTELSSEDTLGRIDIASPEDELKAAKGKPAEDLTSLPRERQISPEELESQGAQGFDSSHLKQRRRRSAGGKDVFIDVMAVVAYDLYKEWFDVSRNTTQTEKHDDAVHRLRKYLAVIMSEVDLHFQYISSLSYRINIRLVGYIMADTAASSPWTEKMQEDGTPYPMLDAEAVLLILRKWVHDPAHSLPPADYFILFSRYNLYVKSEDGEKNPNVAGLAYRNGACADPENFRYCRDCNVALVEVDGLAETVFHTVHEVAHSLGARHDGEDNDCLKSQNYVMRADGDYAITDENAVNHGQLSPCSVKYFDDRITELSSSPGAASCLFDAVTASDVPPPATSLPGQAISPDDQCRLFFGEESEACTSLTKASGICLDLYCTDPLKVDVCRTIWAARGTSCGNKKWCINGQCVYSDDAPSMDDACILGDTRIPPVLKSNLTCAEHYALKPFYCYNQGFREMCCETCKRNVTNIPGCEYGDKTASCRLDHCKDFSHLCCQTCSPANSTTSAPPQHVISSTTPLPVRVTTAEPTSTVPTEAAALTTTAEQATSAKEELSASDGSGVQKSLAAPGQVPEERKELHEQCMKVVGDGSEPCMFFIGNSGKGPEAVCHKGLYCSMPGNSSVCYKELSAAQYTPCGDKKWCIDSECVQSPDAPSRDPDCVFGDLDGQVYPGSSLTCPQLGTKERVFCHYRSVKGRHCCQTCKRLAEQNPGCPYGDYPGNLAVQFPNGTTIPMVCPDFVKVFHRSCQLQTSFAFRYCCDSCLQHLRH